MIPLYTPEEYESAKSNSTLPLECLHCRTTFMKEKRFIKSALKLQTGRHRFCSFACRGAQSNQTKGFNCTECGSLFTKKNSQAKKSTNHFCSTSCSATYNNKNKNHGTRRSKLEVWLEAQLTQLYPFMSIHFNRKDAINSELDIYIPELHLAFELNGIFHYEPIYGHSKLTQVQNNDHRKFQACAEAGIGLCVIDTSGMNYFKPANASKYLAIITGIMDSKVLNS